MISITPIKDLKQTWHNRLQSHGYRLTAPRRAVIEAIASSQIVLTPLDIYERARRLYSRLGLVTVYRTIEKLDELGLIQRVHRPEGCQAFIAAFEGHQHILICQQCGRVTFFSGESEQIEPLIQGVSTSSGFTVTDHWLQLFGLCSECKDGKVKSRSSG